MIIRKDCFAKRGGAAAIETAFVMIPVMLFFLGIFQYGRLLMDWNVLNNAAREGCRYALVNNTASTISTDVTNIVTGRMGNETANFTNFTVTVSGTHNGVATAVNNLVAGDLITVTVSGKYKFMSLPLIPTPTLTINSSVTMLCEGAM
jgi:Flp pilus assembly protein TadG